MCLCVCDGDRERERERERKREPDSVCAFIHLCHGGYWKRHPFLFCTLNLHTLTLWEDTRTFPGSDVIVIVPHWILHCFTLEGSL